MPQETAPAPTLDRPRPDWFFHASFLFFSIVLVVWLQKGHLPRYIYERYINPPWWSHPYWDWMDKVNLSEWFWINRLKMTGATYKSLNLLVRELPGLAAVGAYLVLLPWLILLLIKLVLGLGFARQFRAVRYYPLTVLFLLLAYVPLWIYLHKHAKLRYVVFLPEYFIQI